MNRSKIDFRSALSVVLLALTASGCTICASPDLDSYTTYGGLWHRTDRNHGRVGSLFAPAGVRTQNAAGRLDADDDAELEYLPPGEPAADQPQQPSSRQPDQPGDAEDATEPRERPDLRDLELDDIDDFLPPVDVPEA